MISWVSGRNVHCLKWKADGIPNQFQKKSHNFEF